jgi:hypothetical protein
MADSTEEPKGDPIETEQEELIHKGINSETEDWPDALKEDDPGPDADAEERLDWYNRSRQTADLLAENDEGEEDEAPSEEEIKSQKREQVSYGL